MPLEESTPSEYQRVFAEMAQERPDAIIVHDIGDLIPYRELIIGWLRVSSSTGRRGLTLNDLPDKSSIGSKMIASAGSASVPVHRSYMAEGGAPPAPIGGFPIASCRLKKLPSQA